MLSILTNSKHYLYPCRIASIEAQSLLSNTRLNRLFHTHYLTSLESRYITSSTKDYPCLCHKPKSVLLLFRNQNSIPGLYCR